jgi:dienelactone hydrolase
MKKLFLAFVACALAVSAHATIVTKTVSYEQGGITFKGYLAYDDAKVGSGGKPGVLVVPEWWGLSDYPKHRAEQIAALGYVGFAVDMYGDGKFSRKVADAKAWSGPLYGPGEPMMAARAQAALDALLKTGLVDANKVAAIGYCFGGSTCQALAYSGAQLAGIVSYHGGIIPIPAGGVAAMKCKVLFCTGALDSFVPESDQLTFKKAMDDGKIDYEFISYAGAVHAFTNPDADKLAAENGMTGHIAYNKAADQRSWATTKAFFKEIFGESKM